MTIFFTRREIVDMAAYKLGVLAVGQQLSAEDLLAIDRGMSIEEVRLIEKRGGKSGEWRAPKDKRR